MIDKFAEDGTGKNIKVASYFAKYKAHLAAIWRLKASQHHNLLYKETIKTLAKDGRFGFDSFIKLSLIITFFSTSPCTGISQEISLDLLHNKPLGTKDLLLQVIIISIFYA